MLLFNQYDPSRSPSPPVSTEQTNERLDVIPLEAAATLADLFRERIRRSPDDLAYRQYDTASESWQDWSWAETGRQAARWRTALKSEGLQAGDRVAIMLRNCREWVCYDLAAQSLGLVTVPLFPNDRPDNCGYILEHADARLLLLEGAESWEDLTDVIKHLPALKQLEQPFGMLFFLVCRLFKNRCNLDIAFLFCLACKIGIAVSCLRFTCKCC